MIEGVEYGVWEYTTHGSYYLVHSGDTESCKRYVEDLANELGATVTWIDGRFVEFGVCYAELGSEGVFVIEEGSVM